MTPRAYVAVDGALEQERVGGVIVIIAGVVSCHCKLHQGGKEKPRDVLRSLGSPAYNVCRSKALGKILRGAKEEKLGRMSVRAAQRRAVICWLETEFNGEGGSDGGRDDVTQRGGRPVEAVLRVDEYVHTWNTRLAAIIYRTPRDTTSW